MQLGLLADITLRVLKELVSSAIQFVSYKETKNNWSKFEQIVEIEYSIWRLSKGQQRSGEQPLSALAKEIGMKKWAQHNLQKLRVCVNI